MILSHKRLRKDTKFQARQREIDELRKLVELQKRSIDQITELNKRLIEKLAGMGIKARFDKGEIVFETVRM